MSRSPKPLGDVMDELIDKMGLRGRIDEAQVVEEWASMAGPRINKVTDSAWMRRGTLYVKITSSVWRHQLHLQRDEWKDRLNGQLGRKVVKDIIFR